MIEIVAGNEVKVGDKIFNSSANHIAFRWCRVNEIEHTTTMVRFEHGQEQEVPALKLVTRGWYTVKLPNEGVAVLRGNNADE